MDSCTVYFCRRGMHVLLITQQPLIMSMQEELETLKKEQISAEMQMVEVLDELLQSFERSYSELVESSKQLIMSFFTTARDLEGTFHAQLVVVGQKLYDEKYGIEVCSCSIFTLTQLKAQMTHTCSETICNCHALRCCG